MMVVAKNYKNRNHPGRAVVTGASSGIGAAYADLFAGLGYDLLLIARSRNLLEEKATFLADNHHIVAEVFSADLSNLEDIQRTEEKLEITPEITMLVNNAGVGGVAEFVDLTEDQTKNMIFVNILALTRLTHCVLPKMLEKGTGAIINVSSGLAYTHMPGVSIYGATKAYVSQFTQLLYEEIKGKGVRLQALVPGLTRTNFGPGEGMEFYDRFPPEMVMSPEDLVRASYAGLQLEELVCIPGLASYNEWLETIKAMRHIGDSVSSRDAAQRYQFKKGGKLPTR